MDGLPAERKRSTSVLLRFWLNKKLQFNCNFYSMLDFCITVCYTVRWYCIILTSYP